MNPTPMRRTFRNPGDIRGIPGVTRRRPGPVRETPLPGTRKLSCPKDDRLLELVTGRRMEAIEPSRTSTALGILAVVSALLLNSMIVFQGTRYADAFGTAGTILLLALVHILAIFSQILSNGRNQLGPWAILVLYGGAVLSLILLHFLS